MSHNRAVLLATIVALGMPALSLLDDAAAQETRPQVLSKAHNQMSGGVIDGPLEVSASLYVNGPLVVDGELVLGAVNPIFTRYDVTSEGNAAAEVPGKRKAEVWEGTWTVGGALVVHGPLTVHGTLYPTGGLTVGGPLACAKQPEESVLLPAGLNPIGGPIHWSCD